MPVSGLGFEVRRDGCDGCVDEDAEATADTGGICWEEF